MVEGICAESVFCERKEGGERLGVVSDERESVCWRR